MKAWILSAVVFCSAVTSAVAGDTQIVVQWPMSGPHAMSLDGVITAKNEIAKALGRAHFVDGFDYGSGTANVFVYSEDDRVQAAVEQIIGLVHKKRIPQGVRIARAEYSNSERTDWEYRPVYPPGMDTFALMD